MDFKSSVEDIDEVTKKISVVVAKERVASEYQKTLKSVGRTAKLDGFRPGKVPLKTVERLMSDRIKFDITNTLINEALRGAFQEFKLEVVGQPQIDLKEMQSDSELDFTATVEVMPHPTVANYFDRAVEAPKKEVSEQDVDQALEKLVESRAELTPIEGRTELESGDVAALSVAVKIEDGEFSRPEPFVDQVGLGRLSKQVEEQLVGLKANEEKVIEIVADDTHPIEGVRGKRATYQITLHGLYLKKLPTLDDDFAKSVGMEVDSLEALRAKLKAQLVETAEKEASGESQAALLALLVKEHEFKIPTALIDEEIREMVVRMGFAGQNPDPESIDISKYKPYFEQAANQRIRTAIIIDSIGAQENVKIEEADTRVMLERVARENEVTVEVATKALMDKSRIGGFMAEVRRSKILDMLMARTTVNYVAGQQKAA